MPHLHLNLHDARGVLPDQEGADFADVAEARRQALEGIRSVLSADVLIGELDMSGHLEIVDDGGLVVDVVRFDEALRVTPAATPKSS